MGVAQDPIIAAQKIKRQIPDVITLDIEMPRMDGLTFLRKIMQQHPMPVAICSSLVCPGADTLDKAIKYGAAEIKVGGVSKVMPLDQISDEIFRV